jgi:purine-binding chemotaxis protein CheW
MSALSRPEHEAVAQLDLREVLTLRMGEEEYAINILAIQEIRRFEQPTRIANAPAHTLGVCDLRGLIVPVHDLRRFLGLPAPIDDTTATVVVRVGRETVGLVVDTVSDVVGLAPEQIKPPPALGQHAAALHLIGLAPLRQADQDRLLILLDIQGLVQSL